MRDSPVVATKEKNRSFADFAKIPPQKDCFPAVFRLCRNDQSKERINLPGVTLFDLWRISNRSGGKVGVPPRQFHSRSSVRNRNATTPRHAAIAIRLVCAGNGNGASSIAQLRAVNTLRRCSTLSQELHSMACHHHDNYSDEAAAAALPSLASLLMHQ